MNSSSTLHNPIDNNAGNHDFIGVNFPYFHDLFRFDYNDIRRKSHNGIEISGAAPENQIAEFISFMGRQ